MKQIHRIALYILVLTVVFGTIFSADVAQAAKLPAGSTIAGVSVEKLSSDEAREKLLKEIESWKTKESFVVKSNKETFLIPRSAFQFHIENTLDEIESKTKRRWYTFFVRPKNVHLPIEVTLESDIDWPEYIDEKATTTAAEQVVAELGDQAKIVYEKDKEIHRVKVSEVTFKVPETSDALMGHFVDKLNELTIEPKEPFSFIESVLEPLNITRSTEEVNFVATALYTLVLQSNIDLIERHSQGVIPSYAEAGVEAKVSLVEKKDLKFYNDKHYSYNVRAERRNNELVMSLHAPAKETSFNYRIANQKEIKPRTVYRYSTNLNPSQKQTIHAGAKGLKVEVYRDQLSHTNHVVESTLVSRDYYPPKPTVVLVYKSSGADGELATNEGEEDDSSPESFPSLSLNQNDTDMSDDPFLALEELEKQFQSLMDLLSLLSIVSNLNEFSCEEIENEDLLKLCEEISEGNSSANESEKTAQ